MTLELKTIIVDNLRAKGWNPGGIFMQDLADIIKAHGYEIVQRDPFRSDRAYVDAPLRSHVAFMLEKLNANAHKGPWDDFDALDVYRKAMHEMEELLEALLCKNEGEISYEAADVSNFMLMISDLSTKHVTRRDTLRNAIEAVSS